MININKTTHEQGFTLLELILALTITIMIALIGSDFIINGFRSTNFEREQAEAITTARKALDAMSVEIRGANSSERGDYILNKIDDDQLIFYSDINKDDRTEYINYYVEGTKIKRAVFGPDSNNDYNIPFGTTTIASYLNNKEEPIFEFYTASSSPTETATINEIRMIKINLKINVTPLIAPGDYYVSTNIKLRNVLD